jgi:hypothetical protein
MLIDKGFSQGDTVSLKLVNGDELIACFEEETATEYKISRPLGVTLTSTGLGMIPWVFLGENEKLSFKKEHIFVIVRSKEDAAKQYLQGTTGIALK